MNAPAPFHDIGLDALKAGLQAGQIVLVDVREADEYASGHIAGALFNPLSRFDPSSLPVPKPGERLVIYCRSGRRSVSAMEQARLAGRGDADTHFGGGILGWVGAGEPIATGMEP